MTTSTPQASQQETSRLEQYRREGGLSQVKLGQLVGLSGQTIYHVEAGHYLPRMKNAIAIAKALDVDLSDLFE